MRVFKPAKILRAVLYTLLDFFACNPAGSALAKFIFMVKHAHALHAHV